MSDATSPISANPYHVPDREPSRNDEVLRVVEQCFRAVGLASSTHELWVCVRTFLSQLDRHGYEIVKNS